MFPILNNSMAGEKERTTSPLGEREGPARLDPHAGCGCRLFLGWWVGAGATFPGQCFRLRPTTTDPFFPWPHQISTLSSPSHSQPDLELSKWNSPSGADRDPFSSWPRVASASTWLVSRRPVLGAYKADQSPVNQSRCHSTACNLHASRWMDRRGARP